MNEAIKTKIEEAYQEWLMDTCPEDISCKDDLIDKVCQGFRVEDFIKAIQEEVF